ncbi:MAG: hypothetical protein HYT93_00975 [Parcubacteria group bacterium]|nr:hypothetical protein [Parcubacteria group bacterium]
MSSKTVWDEIQDLLFMTNKCLPKYGPDTSHLLVGDFMCCRDDLGEHGASIFKAKDESFFTHLCWIPEHPRVATWRAKENRVVMIIGKMIFVQPPVFPREGLQYPVFHEGWKRNDDGVGILDFFRIDLSLETFAYYSREHGFSTVKQGDPKLCKDLPDIICGLNEIFNHAILWEIDFEAEAEKILRESLLREFTDACKKARVIN